MFGFFAAKLFHKKVLSLQCGALQKCCFKLSNDTESLEATKLLIILIKSK